MAVYPSSFSSPVLQDPAPSAYMLYSCYTSHKRQPSGSPARPRGLPGGAEPARLRQHACGESRIAAHSRARLALEELLQSLWLSVIPVGDPSSWLYSGSFLTHHDPLAQSMRFPSLDSTPCSPFSQSVASIVLESMNRPLDCCPFSLMNVRLSPS